MKVQIKSVEIGGRMGWPPEGVAGPWRGAEVTCNDGGTYGVWFIMNPATFSGVSILEGKIRNRQKKLANKMSAVRKTDGAWGRSFELHFGAFMRSEAGKAAFAKDAARDKAEDELSEAFDAAHMEKRRMEIAAFELYKALKRLHAVNPVGNASEYAAALIEAEGAMMLAEQGNEPA